jgi:hypothetical protein
VLLGRIEHPSRDARIVNGLKATVYPNVSDEERIVMTVIASVICIELDAAYTNRMPGPFE